MNLKLTSLIVLFMSLNAIVYAQPSTDGSGTPAAPTELKEDGKVPAKPIMTMVSTNEVGDKIISRGAPPLGEVWYWQTFPNGTDRSNSNATYTVSAEGTRNIYLRAYRPSDGLWGSAIAQTVTVTKSLPKR